ncbi:MAG TPA: hypothetical protein VJ603_09200 [Paucimonas sp.]|nr:hypothetical protein [Paucimonas sp.]HJW54884.1 hypothetical protein [Burkholderiaceae bacterium]
MFEALRLGRWIAAGALALGYALLAHHTNTAAGTATLGVLLALAPLVLAALSLAWHARRRIAMLALFGLGCAALAANWSVLTHHYDRIYWFEHAGTELILCLTFGRTLASGREPMCTTFARAVHGTITPTLARYSRQVTVAWVGFFGAMAAASTTIFLVAPLSVWSAFANFFTAPLIAAMFVLEYLVRRYLHPHMEHAHILDAVKAFWKAPAG